jgi:hypothetical protein
MTFRDRIIIKSANRTGGTGFKFQLAVGMFTPAGQYSENSSVVITIKTELIQKNITYRRNNP